MTDQSSMTRPLLEVNDLSIYFEADDVEVCAVRDVSFSLAEREIVGLVGESGSGKSVTGLALLSLLPSEITRITGRAVLDGKDLLNISKAELQKVRGNELSMVFQDSLTALDPVFSIGRQITDTIRNHRPETSRAQAKSRAIELLASVGIPEPASRFRDFPHQLSGGMRQRVMIAIALACEPKLLIADEPTTALDVTIQAQILDVLREVARDHGTAILLISHDLGVVSELCSRVMTMYAGEIVEQSTSDQALEKPLHPYTSGLIQAIPNTDIGTRRLQSIPGRVPALDEMPDGCRFAPRCAFVEQACRDAHPELRALRTDRLVRCIRAESLHLPGALSGQSAVPIAQGTSRIEAR